MFMIRLRGVFNKTTCESYSNKMKRDVLVAKAKNEMIKPLAWLYVRPKGGIIGRSDEVSPIKPPRPRGGGVSPLKKTQSILALVWR